MRATLQWETLKKLLRDQYGVPDGITDQIDNVNRLSYKEGYEDRREDEKNEREEQSLGDDVI